MRRFFTKIQKYIICKNLCVYCLTNIHSLVFLCKNFLWRSPSHLDNLCINKIIYKGSRSPAKMIIWQTSSSRSICCKPVIIYHFAAIEYFWPWVKDLQSWLLFCIIQFWFMYRTRNIFKYFSFLKNVNYIFVSNMLLYVDISSYHRIFLVIFTISYSVIFENG